MKGVTLDAGALIAYERGDRRVLKVVARANETGVKMAIPAGVVGQVWRDGRVQVRLGQLLKSPAVELVVLDVKVARAAGQLCGARRTADVIDASVVLCARERGHRVMTSDPRDLGRLDSKLELVVV